MIGNQIHLNAAEDKDKVYIISGPFHDIDTNDSYQSVNSLHFVGNNFSETNRFATVDATISRFNSYAGKC